MRAVMYFSSLVAIVSVFGLGGSWLGVPIWLVSISAGLASIPITMAYLGKRYQ